MAATESAFIRLELPAKPAQIQDTNYCSPSKEAIFANNYLPVFLVFQLVCLIAVTISGRKFMIISFGFASKILNIQAKRIYLVPTLILLCVFRIAITSFMKLLCILGTKRISILQLIFSKNASFDKIHILLKEMHLFILSWFIATLPITYKITSMLRCFCS